MNRKFSEEKIKMINKHEKMLKSLVIERMQIETEDAI